MATPREIRKLVEGTGLRVTWDDGHASEWSAQALRGSCRCAACRDERTGESLLSPGQIPATVRIEKLEAVGRYAVGVVFSDGHGSGIFSFDHLRQQCPCCQPTSTGS